MPRIHGWTLPFLAACALFVSPAAAEESWSRFRGPNGTGVSTSGHPPVEVGPEANVEWRTEVPFGRSSPVVGGARVFVTGIDGGRFVTMAFDVETGEVAWRAELEPLREEEMHQATDSATPTPATDGTNVYAFFQEAGLVSYDAAGKERWRVALGPFQNFYGMAASPVVWGGRVYQVCDQAFGSFVVAFDATSGEEVWRRERPARAESYTTPILHPSAEAPETLLVLGSRWIDAYDLGTGEVAWSVGGVGSGPVASPVLVGDTLFVAAPDHAEGGFPEFETITAEHDADGDGRLTRGEVEETWLERNFGWLDGDGSGIITAEDWARIDAEMKNDNWGVFALRLAAGGGEVLWNYRSNVPYIPSPLVVDGVVWLVEDGIVTTLDAESGERLHRGRLTGGGADVYASPVAAGGHVYVGTLDGDLAVLEGGGTWTVAKVNELGEEIHATPAVVGDALYLRTKGHLYRFGSPASPATTAGADAP